MNRRAFLPGLIASALGLSAIPAAAQGYPNHPIALIVPFPAGGPTDALARILAGRMQASLGQPMVIENVAGAGGTIGVARAARAPADGYTLVMGNSGTHVVNGAIYSLQYDLVEDFKPIMLIARETPIIVARKTLPATDLKELIAWLRANPDKALQATSGVGTPPHLAGVLFQRVTNTRFQFVPYRGAAPAMQDLVAGQVDFDIESPVTTLPQIRAGAVKAYAVTAETRSATAPDIPTVDEAGLSGFHVSSWFALFAPREIPNDVLAKLRASASDALSDPKTRQPIVELGLELPRNGEQEPQMLGALQKADIQKWWPIIKSAGIRAQ